MSDSNVVSIADKQMETTLRAIRKIQATLPVIVEGQKAMAQVVRARYLALVEQGFTPEQALALCKA